MEVPHLRISVTEGEIMDGAKSILPMIRPEWDLKSVRFKIFTDGITNKLLGCFNGCEENDVILIRVYGNKTNLLIDRRAETRNFKLLNAAGLAPRLYATFDTGLVYEYVPGDVLTVDTCRIDRISQLVARTMADVHCVKMEDNVCKKPVLWTKIRKFMDLALGKFTRVSADGRFKELFRDGFDLEKEYSFLKMNLCSLDSPSVFCHNDLLLSNIIFNKERNLVTFIDYEYAGYNYQAYDIANHFNEYAGVDTVNYDLFPDYEYQIRWLRFYLERYHSNLDSPYGTKAVSDEEIFSLYDSVQKFTLASHFLWGVWSLIQSESSSIDFDFLNYAFARFKEYFARKSEIYKC